MPSQITETIKERLNIIDIVGQYVKLEKAGNSLKARCPFHTEKTPSFFVSPTRNSYYCFGCGEKGDIFTFVEKVEGVDFKGALKTLAERAGVPLVFERSEEKDARARLYTALEEAAKFFETTLTGEPGAVAYLESRGVKEATRQMFRLGYAPLAWRDLKTYLFGLGFIDEELAHAGLVKKSEEHSGYYDRFRGRIMFPIADSVGRIIAFTGRVFPENNQGAEMVAKYLNSPETLLFDKSRVLFGFDRAKHFIRKLNFAVVVEGQTDLLAAHQIGYCNTVALSGTALSPEQCVSLQRLSDNVVLALDADNAGVSAVGRSATVALAAGLDVKVASLPAGSDPADLIARDPDGWRKSVREAKHVVEFYLEQTERRGHDERALRRESSKATLPFIAMIPSAVDKSHFVSLVATRIKIREDALWQELGRVESSLRAAAVQYKKQIPGKPIVSKTASEKKADKRSALLRTLFSILYWLETLNSPPFSPKDLQAKLDVILGEEAIPFADRFTTVREQLIFEAERAYGETGNISADIVQLLHHLEIEALKGKLERETSALREAENNGDFEDAHSCLSKCNSLREKLAQLHV